VSNNLNRDTGRGVVAPRKLDYGNFDLQWLARFPGYILAHDPSKERSWWWQHGYRLKRKINGVVKHRWVCAECVAKHHPPLITKYTYDASTGKCIEPHFEIHRICNPDGQSEPARDGKQPAITQYLGIDDVDPRNQAIAAKFAKLVNPEILNIRFMNWLVSSNLPFRVIDNKAFKSLMAVINPGITLPSHCQEKRCFLSEGRDR
jgi:hypothetical protein